MLSIYTDGSCIGNPGPGGWGFVVVKDGKTVEHSGNQPDTTNNRMEMQAMIEALKWSRKNAPEEKILILSDSNLLVQTFQKNWKRKANLDLWHQIDSLLSGQQVTFQWVKGHSTNRYNARCDQLAQEQSRLLMRNKRKNKTDDRLF